MWFPPIWMEQPRTKHINNASPEMVLGRPLIMVHGKGGVGKTSLSTAIAAVLAHRGNRTLHVSFDSSSATSGEPHPNIKWEGLWQLNCDPMLCFEEYASRKIGLHALTRLFLKNRLIQYLANAAPGIRELVMLGKVWHELTNFDRIVVDMPSTGYALTMLKTPFNFSRLFKGGGIQQNTLEMLETFGSPVSCGHLILSLPEEMPLQEAMELHQHLIELFPANQPAFMVNRLFPQISTDADITSGNPIPSSVIDYIEKRSAMEAHNLRLWSWMDSPYGKLEAVPPQTGENGTFLIEKISSQLTEKGYL